MHNNTIDFMKNYEYHQVDAEKCKAKDIRLVTVHGAVHYAAQHPSQ